jgi:hypothetical protein
MRRLRPIVLVLLCAVLAGALNAPVAAAAANPVVVDCTAHNQLTHTYTVAQLRNALATMSADVKEYTACPDIIQRALNAQLGGLHASGGGSSGGGSFLPTPVIVLLVVLILGGATFAALALRRRGGADQG